MISKQAQQLVKKLNNIKLSENKDGKKLRILARNIKDYDSKMKKYFISLDERIAQTQKQYNILRQYEKQEQQQAINKIDQFQISLKKLLNSYSEEARQAKNKLNYMYEKIKQEMKNTSEQTINNEKQKIQRYNLLSRKLEEMIDYVRDKQKKSIDQHEKLKDQIRLKYDQMIEKNKLNQQEIERRSNRIEQMFNCLEQKIISRLNKFNQKIQSNNYQVNKSICLLLQQLTSQ